jgi:uncharacterized protein YbjQ (UPF0145 family)
VLDLFSFVFLCAMNQPVEEPAATATAFDVEEPTAAMQQFSVDGPSAAALAFDETWLSTVISAHGRNNPDNTLRSLGMVRGITVRSRNIGADIGAGVKSLAGGEIRNFTTLCEGARQEALTRMIEQAAERGANGVLCVRYDTNTIVPGVTEVLAYGLAVTDSSSHNSADLGVGTEEGINANYICSSNELPGFSVHRSLGVVSGNTVRSRNIAKQIGAVGKAVVGGEVRNWTKMCEDARQEAHTRMLAEALARGANGVVGMRYSTNEVRDGITEVIAYGTAVSSKPESTRAASSQEGYPASAEPVQASAEHKQEPSAEPGQGVPLHMVTTSNTLPSLNICHANGVVKGISVRSCNLMRQIGAGLKSLAGGEIRNFADMCNDARALAFDRMVEEAGRMGAKGIISMRYDAKKNHEAGFFEVLAYGVAVFDEQSQPPQTEITSIPHSLVTTDVKVPGRKFVRSLGIVRGVSVKSLNIFLGIGAAFKGLVGGEIWNFTHLCEQARHEAYCRMLAHAHEMGATGVVGMRFESNDHRGNICVVAFGTAVCDTDQPAAAAASSEAQSQEQIHHSCLSTTDEVHGQDFQRSLGIVKGVTCRSKNFFQNVGADLKAGTVGGEIHTWVALCEQSRVEATERLVEEAVKKGAKGIVGMRYEANEIGAGMSEIIAFGTAVA